MFSSGGHRCASARLPRFVLVAMILLSAGIARAQHRYVLSDFEDVGTWYVIGSVGTPPDAWFAGSLFFGSSQLEKRNGDYVGELRYRFADQAPTRRITYERERAIRVSAFVREIAFDANAKGVELDLQFDLLDAANRLFRTRPVRLDGDGWKSHSVKIDATTINDFEAMRMPVRLARLSLTSPRDGAAENGAVFLDDITLVGQVTTERILSAFPVADRISYRPDEPLQLKYRLRLADGSERDVSVQTTVSDRRGNVVQRASATGRIPKFAPAEIAVAIPALPLGAYQAKTEVVAGDLRLTYDDWIGVMVPNGPNYNKGGMAFGIADQTVWNADAENALHRNWIAELGIDLARLSVSGGRTEPVRGRLAVDPIRRWAAQLDEIGVDVMMLYTDSVPEFTKPSPANRGGPTDHAAFAEHAKRLGAELASIPNLKYLEFWNEPDLFYFGGTIDEFVAMMQTFYPAFKSAAPNIDVTSGSITVNHPQTKPDFAPRMFQQGAPYYDVAVYHSHGPVENYERAHTSVMSWLKVLDKPKRFGNTESGDRDGYQVAGAWRHADTVVRKLTYAKAIGSEFHIWFTLQDFWDMHPKADDSMGLVTCDNRAKPSFVAFNQVVKQLANTEPLTPLALHPKLVTYSFARPTTQQHVHVCWPRKPGESVVFAVESPGPVQRVDMFGAVTEITPQDGIAYVSVAGDPVYVITPHQNVRPVPLDFIEPNAEVYLVAGEKGEVEITLRNPWNAAARFEVELERDGVSRGTVSEAVEPRTNKVVSLAVTVPPETPVGSLLHRLKVTVTGGAKRSLEMPVTINVAYPIRSNASEAVPVPIRVDDESSIREIAFDPSVPHWKGAADLSVSARFSHDDSNLYLSFDVIDDVHRQTEREASIWRGDSVQFGIHAGEGRHTVLAAALTSEGPVLWRHQAPAGKSAGRLDAPVTIDRRGTTTEYRITLPLAELGIEPRLGSGVRLSFLVNEDDGLGRVRYMRWFDGIGLTRQIDAYGFGVFR
jgi:hypothetical protein